MIFQSQIARAPVAPSWFSSLSRPRLQRKCACGGTPGPTGECEACRRKRLQRKASQPSTFNSQPAEVPPIVHDVLRSPGRPLHATTRGFGEPRFRYDFTDVRVHTDAQTTESVRMVNADAYTAGVKQLVTPAAANKQQSAMKSRQAKIINKMTREKYLEAD